MQTSRRVTAPDGVSLAVRESGPTDARAFVLLHGIAQSGRSWDALLDGPLTARRRLVALDLRGHGDSDKPDDVGALSRAHLAGDLAAVIDQLGLRRPVIVAWSYGGVVVGEYLRRYGDAALGGVVWVAAAVKTGRDTRGLYGPTMLDHARALLSDEPAVYTAGARAFARGCAAGPLDPVTLERIVAEMLRVPPHVRRAFLSGAEDYTDDVARTTVPMATVHGEADAVVTTAMSERIEGAREGVGKQRLAGVGHLPWIEAPGALEAALVALDAR
jgi:pimeloyl-ACP methyl ester carboxylesterase